LNKELLKKHTFNPKNTKKNLYKLTKIGLTVSLEWQKKVQGER
jgi:hypothetical protein